MEKEKEIPEQHQTRQPGIETEMTPEPDSTVEGYKGSGKLELRSRSSLAEIAALAARLPLRSQRRARISLWSI